MYKHNTRTGSLLACCKTNCTCNSTLQHVSRCSIDLSISYFHDGRSSTWLKSWCHACGSARASRLAGFCPLRHNTNGNCSRKSSQHETYSSITQCLPETVVLNYVHVHGMQRFQVRTYQAGRRWTTVGVWHVIEELFRRIVRGNHYLFSASHGRWCSVGVGKTFRRWAGALSRRASCCRLLSTNSATVPVAAVCEPCTCDNLYLHVCGITKLSITCPSDGAWKHMQTCRYVSYYINTAHLKTYAVT